MTEETWTIIILAAAAMGIGLMVTGAIETVTVYGEFMALKDAGAIPEAALRMDAASFAMAAAVWLLSAAWVISYKTKKE